MPAPRNRRSERAPKPDYEPPVRPVSVISLQAHPSSVEFLAGYNAYVDRTDAPMSSGRWRDLAVLEMMER